MIAPRPSVAMLEEAAARWIIRREEDGWSEHDDAELAAWLELSDAHRAAFWRLDYGWREADRVGSLGVAVVALPLRRLRQKWVAGKRALVGLPIRAGAIALVVVAGVLWQTPMPPKDATRDFRTPVGGRRILTLADGSRIEMNTRTRVIAFTMSGRREVWLEDGEAFFDIVHNPKQTFLVHVGNRTVTVLGTRFLVRRDGKRVTVAVASGRVRIEEPHPASGGPNATTIAAGDIAVVQPYATQISTESRADIEALTAWRESQIVFDETPLSAAVAEFNRYSDVPIVIRDANLGRVRIGGTFRTDDSRSFITLLRKAYGVRVEYEPETVVLHQ